MASQDTEDAEAIQPFIRVRMVDLQMTRSSPLPHLLHAYQPPKTGATSFPFGQLPEKVPIIRIFGTTPANQKCCVNVHGIWPYMFVDYPAGESLAPETVHKFTHRLAVSLNAALCSSLRQNEFGGKARGGVDTRRLHVASVVLVKGVPFYGYHVGYSYYLKISLVTPSHIYRAVELLERGSVMAKKFTVYEAHLAPKLQFMIDYDLYGCGWVDLDGGKFREPLPEGDPFEAPGIQDMLFNSLTIQPINRYEFSPARETWAQLEIDVLPWQIINRRRLEPRYWHDSLRELLRPESIDPDEKLVRSVRELWAEENRRRVEKGLPELNRQSQGIDGSGIKRISLSQEDKGWKGGDWDASPRFWAALLERIEGEKRMKDYTRTPLDKMGEPSVMKGHAQWDRFIMTTFESVETGWPKSIKTPTRRTVSQRSRKVKPSSPALPSDRQEESEDDSDAEMETNPFELTRTSQEGPPMAADPDVKIDESVIQDFERSEAHHELLEDEAIAEAEIQGWRRPLEFTPKKGEMPWDEADRTCEEAEEEEGLVQHLSQVGKQKASQRGLQTPMRSSQRNRMSSVTPNARTNPSTFGLRPFATSSVTPGKNGHTAVNPYLSNGHLANGSPMRNGPSPLKHSTNRFARDESPTAVTPSKRNLSVRNGIKLSEPSKIRMLDHASQAKEEEDGFDDLDDLMGAAAAAELNAEPSARTRLFADSDVKPRSTPLVKSEASPFQADEPALPPAQPKRSVVVEPEPPPLKSALKRSRPAWDEQQLQPTFVDLKPTLQPTMVPPGQTVPPGSSDAQSTAASSLAPTAVSSNASTGERGRIAKRVRMDHSTISSNGEAKPALASHPSISLASDSVKSDSIPPEMLAPRTWKYRLPPLSRRGAKDNLEAHHLPSVKYQTPYYSRPDDVCKGAVSFGTGTFFVKSNTVAELSAFESSSGRNASRVRLSNKATSAVKQWLYSSPPPSRKQVRLWSASQAAETAEKEAMKMQSKLASQWGGPTQANKYGYKVTDKKKNSNSQRERQNMSSLALEVFATSQGRLLPNPESDPIVAVFYCLQDEEIDMDGHPERPGHTGVYTGIMMVRNAQLDQRRIGAMTTVHIDYYDSELDLINEVITRVKLWDPDVLAGWEVHASSWGYLVDRAGHEFAFALSDDLSRVVATHQGPRNDNYAKTHTSSFKVVGRHVFNIWRILRGDLNLLQYSFENVTFQLLHQRFPHYTPQTLTEWYNSKWPEHVVRMLQYHIDKVNMYVEMMDAAEIITKNAEFARVFGVDFNSVMSRGSQFKVESFMFRIAKPESFVLISPSREAVGRQNAAEAQPLIFEPQSVFYNDPIVVLDFQSLYPSIMIGYNYCYSTCLGRVESFKGSQKLGWSDLRIPSGRLEILQDYITISPNGIIYAKQKLRKSLLSKMLGEILETRVMVKNGMKLGKGDKALLQVLNARQLGLKLMANVTYGYTGASFSGRMPCVEIADSIVQTGRETLEKAITFIQSRPEWKADVVYGDTDSLFIHLPGRTRQQAHKLGNEIADAVTALNPKPVKLKFEKVYSASLLMAKKRYVGFKHESIDDEPSFDAKGIETVRRDGFPAGQKMVETCIKMLFRTQNISEIKTYCLAQWSKLREGKVSIQDFTLAKEVKLGSYSDKGPPPPGVMVASRKLTIDPRAEAEYGERVPYVITLDPSKRRLVDRAVSPEDLLRNRHLRLDAEYYIARQLIPPLNRIFNLIGVDVANWYRDMPKQSLVSAQFRMANGNPESRAGTLDQKRSLEQYYKSINCLICGAKMDKQGVCEKCRKDLPSSVHALLSRYHLAQSRLVSSHRICSSCSSTPLGEPQKCESIDCPVLYARVKAGWEAEDMQGVPALIQQLEVEDALRQQGRDADEAILID